MTVKYKARAHFDIETEVEVPDDEAVDDLAVWLAVVNDLENCYGLEIDILKGENDGSQT